MANMGYVNFLGIDCVYFEDNGVFEVLAKDSEQNKEFIPHFEDRNFFFEYVQRYNQRRCAFIESARHFIGGGMELKAKYIVENPRDEAISHMEILGDDIDEFFDPSRYFFTLLNKDSGTIGNVVYNSNKADEWKMVFEGKDIKISLVYGDILKKGVGSDLKLHPRLNLSFPATTDYSFLYRLYLVIVRFMQIVFYRQAHGKYEIDLYASLHNGNISYAGKLIDYAKSETVNENGAREINYNNYKDYMVKLLQFSADNQNLNLTHFPRSISRYRGKDYTQLDFISIFSAFECECTAKKEIYEKVNDQPIANIRAKLLKKIGECNGENEEEKKFIALVSDKITQLGTQFGQKKKITVAYSILSGAMTNSIKNIFYRHTLESNTHLTDSDINKFANYLVRTRGSVAHGGSNDTFSDEDAQIIRFLEIMVYCQMLKRADIDEQNIELIIGAVFTCNQLMFTKYLGQDPMWE